MGDKRKSIESVTDWLGLSEVPNWRAARFLGPVFSMVIVLLFVLAIIAAFAVLFQLVFGGGEVTFGAGALITALLGAPFLIWGTVLKHQTVMFQKEGHMTDRINKAVEQLGAEGLSPSLRSYTMLKFQCCKVRMFLYCSNHASPLENRQTDVPPSVRRALSR